jgi:hypothetical protein
MTFLTDLSEVLQNSNNALAGVFLRNHAKEIVALVEAAERLDKEYPASRDGMDRVLLPVGVKGIRYALAALNKEKNT